MSRPISLGYLQPASFRLNAGPWMVLGPAGDEEANPELLQDWDYATGVRVRRRVEVDLPGVLDDCELGGDARVSLLLLWHSTWTGLRGAAPPLSVGNGTNELELRLAGELLGGALNLEARLVLDDAPARGPLSPARAGSRLWSDTYRLALEGSGMRFPILRVSFGESGIGGGRNGIWALQLDTDDLAASASGNVRLYLNSDHPAVPELLDRPDTPIGHTLEEFLRFDLARQLLVAALRHDELQEIDYDEGSVGELLRSAISRYFDRTLEQLRKDLRTDPGGLEAELQARTELLRS